MATKKKTKRGLSMNAEPIITVTGGPYIFGYGPLKAEIRGSKVKLSNLGCYGKKGEVAMSTILKLRNFCDKIIEAKNYKVTLEKK